MSGIDKIIGQKMKNGLKVAMGMTANEVMLSWPELSDILTKMDEACREGDQLTVRQLMLDAPTGFAPKDEICDLVWMAKQQA